jgi:hypothetical protein
MAPLRKCAELQMTKLAALRLLLAAMIIPLIWQAPSAMAQVTAQTEAEISELRERIRELEIQEMLLQSEIEETGGRPTSQEGIDYAQWRKEALDRQIDDLQRMAEVYAASRADLEALRQRVATEPIKTMADRADGSGNTAGRVTAKVIEKGVEAATGTSLAGVSAIGTLADYGGRLIVRNWNASDIEDLVRSQRLPLIDLLRDTATLLHARNEEMRLVARLEGLQERYREIQSELAPTRHRLNMLTGNAHEEANLQRETDPAGDAEEERKTHGAGVTLCNPSQKPKPFGVRLAGNKSSVGKKATAQKDEEAAADGDSCRDIIGFWSLTETHTHYLGHSVRLPTSRAEIAAAETGVSNSYEIFHHSKSASAGVPFLRCLLSGHELNCQRREQPHKCPPSKHIWTDIKMNIAADVSAITGEFALLYTFADGDPTYCALELSGTESSGHYQFVPIEAAQAKK